jgi:hypothetical protein
MKEDLMKLLIAVALCFALYFVAMVAVYPGKAQASRDSCECRELRAIRQLLQHQLGVVCDERRCLPVPTPTSDGGELP